MPERVERRPRDRQFIGANAAAMRHSGCARGETAGGRFVYELAIKQNKNFVELSGGIVFYEADNHANMSDDAQLFQFHLNYYSTGSKRINIIN